MIWYVPLPHKEKGDQMNSSTKLLVLPFLALTLLNSNLFAQTKVSIILKDRSKYASSNFNKAKLPSSIQSIIDTPSIQFKKFSSITIEYNDQIDETGKKWSERIISKLTRLDNGLIQEETERFKNDIPFSLFYSISHLGLIPLRYQQIHYDLSMANPLFELKEISQFPDGLLNPSENSSTKLLAVVAIEGHPFETRNREATFTIKEAIPSSQISEQLQGKIFIIERENKLNSAISGKDTYYYSPEYGCAFMLRQTNAKGIDTYTISKITIIE